MSQEPQPCKGCGRPILWGRSEDGKPLPLDASAPVYLREFDPETRRTFWVLDARGPSGRIALVSHFVTCPARDQFKKAKAEKQEPVQQQLPGATPASNDGDVW